MTVVTNDEYEAHLAAAPDEYVRVLSVSLDWVDETTISVSTFGGMERLSDRSRNIGVGVSGCIDDYYDVVKKDGVWGCGSRASRRSTSPRCERLLKDYVAALDAPPLCLERGHCVSDECRWPSSGEESARAQEIEAEIEGTGCGLVQFSCAAMGAQATPKLVLD